MKLSRYGPGKFNLCIDAVAYDAAMDGADAECGDAQTCGWHGLIRGQVEPSYILQGPALTEWYRPFEHRGRSFRLTYLEGCFKPFVTMFRGK